MCWSAILIPQGTVEERLMSIAKGKLLLDKLVTGGKKKPTDEEESLDVLSG